MSGTILQAEIDSNHQFVREKGDPTDKLLKIQLVREKVGFYGQVARRESVFSRHSNLAMSLLIRRQAGERTLP